MNTKRTKLLQAKGANRCQNRHNWSVAELSIDRASRDRKIRIQKAINKTKTNFMNLSIQIYNKSKNKNLNPKLSSSLYWSALRQQYDVTTTFSSQFTSESSDIFSIQTEAASAADTTDVLMSCYHQQQSSNNSLS